MNAYCKRGSFVAAILVMFMAFFFTPSVQAATLFWNAGGGGPSGGTGTWDDSSSNWLDESYNSVTWSNNNTAWFTSPAGAVTRTGSTNVNGMVFDTGGYTIAGSGSIGMNSGCQFDTYSGTTIISAVLSGSNGFEKIGPGYLALTGANNFSGTIIITDGALSGNLGSGGGIILNNSGSTTPTLGACTTNRALRVYGTGYINTTYGNGNVTISGNDTVITSGRLIYSGSRSFYMEGISGFNGGVYVGSNTRGFYPFHFAPAGQPSSLGAVSGVNSGTYSDLTFGSNYNGSGKFTPWTYEQSSTCGASWRIPNSLYGEIVHFGMTYPGAGGNTFEMGGPAAATTGRLYVEGGNPTYANQTTGSYYDPSTGSYLGYRYDTFDDPTRTVLAGQNAFSGGIELGCRNTNSYHFISVSNIGNAGETSNVGASGHGTNGRNLMFVSGWLEYTGGTATTNRQWQIASDNTYVNAVNLTKARTDAKFIITNASSTLTMTGDSFVIADTYGPTHRGLLKTGPGTLRLEGNMAYRGRTLLFHKTYDGNPDSDNGLYAGTLSLGPNAQAAIWSGSWTDIQSGKLTMDTSALTSASAVLAELDGTGVGYNASPAWSAGKFQNTAAGSTGMTLGWRDDGTSISIMATINGDTDLNGSTTFTDFLALSSSFGGTGNWQNGDFDYDQSVTFTDFLALSGNFNYTIPGGGGNSMGAVPEPSGVVMLLSLLASAGAWVVVRRRRE
jgi:fibronectin-binding autotransporter adhesin